MGPASVNLTQSPRESAILCEIKHNYDHWAVQGHSRSPILVPIESQYKTYF